jgi:SAM-dependent methyltransferase
VPADRAEPAGRPSVTYRSRFPCLWCGTGWTTRGPDDLEGWARLCPDCLGKAGANPFLRGRLRSALAARAAASSGRAATGAAPPAPTPAAPPAPIPAAPPAGRLPRPSPPAPAAFPDDWFLRRGQFERGAIHDAAWQAELDVVTRWLDGLPLAGTIVEPAAGVGFFSPLLAERGELHASDADGAALDLARTRLVAHRLRAHLHVADPLVVPAGELPADALLATFLVGRVRGAGLDRAAATLRARLRPGGLLAIVDLRPEPAGGPPPGVAWTYHAPAIVEATLARAGFDRLDLHSTGRFFLTASGIAR